MKKDEYVSICPKCGSIDVYNKVSKSGFSMENCRDCEYNNVTFPEIKLSDVESFRRELINK